MNEDLQTFRRRQILAAGLILPALVLPGCAIRLGGFYPQDVVRRLLRMCADRAFASLGGANGFLADPVARIALPAELGGTGGLEALAPALRMPQMQDRLTRQLNHAAQRALPAGAYFVQSEIAVLRINRAIDIIKGGPSSATSYLERTIGNRLFDVLYPHVLAGLRAGDVAAVTEALRLAPGLTINALAYDVSRKASEGIHRTIAREEAAIRANPRSASDRYVGKALAIIP